MGRARQATNILDLGAGAGIWGLTLAFYDPTSQVTAVDFEPSLQVVRKTAVDIQVDSRLRLVAGDFRHAALGEARYDLALVANLLQLEALEQSREWLQRVRHALRPEGEVVVVSSFEEHVEGQSKRSRALESLELGLRTPHGRLPSVPRRDRSAAARRIRGASIRAAPGAAQYAWCAGRAGQRLAISIARETSVCSYARQSVDFRRLATAATSNRTVIDRTIPS